MARWVGEFVMARLWKDLPPEILENVLSRLPFHVLCRFRVVCKGWNHLISQPEFASYCLQSPGQASYILFTPKELSVDIDKAEVRRDWEILDMAEKRFYTLKDSFIADYLCQTEDFAFGWRIFTLAADGGLIYSMYENRYGGIRRYIVCNPVIKGFHEIMALHPFCNRDIIAMSVDVATKSYRFTAMESYDQHYTRTRNGRKGPVFLYDSTTTKWRILCEYPVNKYLAYSSIFMQGILYTLYLDSSVALRCIKLYSCDTETGALSSIDVEFPRSSRWDNLKLVVSSGRLFYVECRRRPMSTYLDVRLVCDSLSQPANKIKQRINMRIWEILPSKKELIQVAKKMFSLKVFRGDLEERSEIVVGDVVAFGCADSIVISSVGHRVRFDFLKNSWHELPVNDGHILHLNPKDKNR